MPAQPSAAAAPAPACGWNPSGRSAAVSSPAASPPSPPFATVAAAAAGTAVPAPEQPATATTQPATSAARTALTPDCLPAGRGRDLNRRPAPAGRTDAAAAGGPSPPC